VSVAASQRKYEVLVAVWEECCCHRLLRCHYESFVVIGFELAAGGSYVVDGSRYGQCGLYILMSSSTYYLVLLLVF
jgi:hypothetical protein